VLSELGGNTPVWATCLFADPIADIAVLGSPDTQELGEQAAAYDRLIGAATQLAIGTPLAWDTIVPVSVIALDGRRVTGKAEHFGGELFIDETAEPIDEANRPPARMAVDQLGGG
jgi:hypothetical protein